MPGWCRPGGHGAKAGAGCVCRLATDVDRGGAGRSHGSGLAAAPSRRAGSVAAHRLRDCPAGVLCRAGVAAGGRPGQRPQLTAAAPASRHQCRVAGWFAHDGGVLSGRTRRQWLGRMEAAAPATCGDERIEVQGRYTIGFDDGNAYLAAALAGLGVVALPSYMAEPHVTRGELLPVLQEWQLPSMPMHVMFPPNRHMSQRLRVFIDWVVEVLG
ncbi:hypothetical protein G6F22_016505 [Rhizopus arrhizus]|nr:hypothetical protein G6F22_016505 [Rhizopus arrhizus]